MFMKSRRQASKKGFTLTEAAIVLGIVGLILGAIWVAAGSVYRNMRVATTTDQLLQIVQAIRSLHATQPAIDPALNIINLSRAGGVPKDMMNDINTPTAITNVWGGAVVLTRESATEFTVTFEDVPNDACADLLTRNTGSGRDTGIVSAGSATDIAAADMPITVTTAIGECTGDTKSPVNFRYALRS